MHLLTRDEAELLREFKTNVWSKAPEALLIETEDLACRGLLVRLGSTDPLPNSNRFGIPLSALVRNDKANRAAIHQYRLSRRAVRLLGFAGVQAASLSDSRFGSAPTGNSQEYSIEQYLTDMGMTAGDLF